MSNTVIKVENLSKQYRLGEVGTGTISHDLNRWWAKVRGKEDPFLKIGETNDRTSKGSSDYVWALKDINFDIQQGDAVGIIGRNGAGKSTLLKILSKTTTPNTGSIKIKGRIASLLEVGTGFHPEMTGRENIFLNGAILGMRKKEIARKFDEIVDFAGVERYVDTPVKRYSSGMYVRLAFAVAAHLESEILIVDEVLAVGDAEFQKKCLGKMGEVSKGEGRTVLFVSHNMNSIKALCQKSILLNNGTIIKFDQTAKTIDAYLRSKINRIDLSSRTDRKGDQKIKLSNIFFSYIDGKEIKSIKSGDDLTINVLLEIEPGYKATNMEIGFGFNNILEERITLISNKISGQEINLINSETTVQLQIMINKLSLVSGEYSLTSFISSNGDINDWVKDAFRFSIDLDSYFDSSNTISKNQGTFHLDYKFII